MKYKQLGRTGLLVSDLCFGTMTFGGRGFWSAIGQLPQDAADNLVGRVLEHVGVGVFGREHLVSRGHPEVDARAAPREVLFGEDERHYLDDLQEIARSGRTPAEELIRRRREEWGGDVTRVFDACAY